jgi:hypothetical protein
MLSNRPPIHPLSTHEIIFQTPSKKKKKRGKTKKNLLNLPLGYWAFLVRDAVSGDVLSLFEFGNMENDQATLS